MRVVQAKRMEEPASYNSRVIRANNSRCRLDRILTKALAAKMCCRLRTGTEARDNFGGPLPLRGELGEGFRAVSPRHAVLLEEVPDAVVAVAALRERRRSRPCVAAIVEVADTFECLERLGASRTVHSGPGEAFLELSP